MLVGDLNCPLPRLPPAQRPKSWAQLRGFNQFSVEMQQLLDEQDLVTAELFFRQPVNFTYERGGHRSHIDHIVVPRSFLGNQLQSCLIIPPCSDNLSPHLPLHCMLVMTVSDGITKRGPERNMSPSLLTVLDWGSDERNNAYRQLLADKLAPMLLQDLSADQLDAQITASIHEPAADAGCSRHRRTPKSWWSPNISKARNRARLWHQMWTEAGRPRDTEIHNCFRAARRDYRRARIDAARAKGDNGARLLSVLRRDRNIKAFWRRVELARRGSATARSTLSADDFAANFSPIHLDDEDVSADHEEINRRVSGLTRALLGGGRLNAPPPQVFRG